MMDRKILQAIIMDKKSLYKTNKLSRRIVIETAELFNLEPMEMVKILESIGVAKSGSVDWFKENGGITKKHVQQAKQMPLIF